MSDIDEKQAIEYFAKAVKHLPEYPKLASWLVAIKKNKELVEFRTARRFVSLTNSKLVSVFLQIEPLLDGTNSLKDILSSLPDSLIDSATIALVHLSFQGVITGALERNEESKIDVEHSTAFFSNFSQNPSKVLERASGSRLSICGTNKLAKRIGELTFNNGINRVDYWDDLDNLSIKQAAHEALNNNVDLVVAVNQDNKNGYLDMLNEQMQEVSIPWLHVRLNGPDASFGPLFYPPYTSCFRCLDNRFLGNHNNINLNGIPTTTKDNVPLFGEFPPFLEVVAGMVSMEVFRIFTNFAPTLTWRNLVYVSAEDLTPSSHQVLRIPGCRVCNNSRPTRMIWDYSI